MNALELQAALVKLDPATTVTPIGTAVKLLPQHRITFTVDHPADAKCISGLIERKSSDAKQTRKSQVVVAPPASFDNKARQQQQLQATKCSIAEVR
ncbi:uncharacterized protein [Prorops nasuta]|uniref:uncharacterized protein n=1 Tax=Prorops nasuta TaxID=863751 RepID=UPI0034CD6E9A